MQVKVGENVYAWGGDARDLANDPMAYGPKVLTQGEAVQLAKAIDGAGWEAFSKRVLEERQVFLIQPKAWRRAVQLPSLPGQILQVREKVKRAERPQPVTGPPLVAPIPPVPDAVDGDGQPNPPAPPEGSTASEPVDPNAGKGDETPEPLEESTYPGSPVSGDAPKEREGA